jgi:hypothetical protein
MGHAIKFRRRRKSSRLKKRLTALALLVVASCAVLLALSVLQWKPEPESERAAAVVAATSPAVSRQASFAVPEAASNKPRRIYPYSIIPGGVSDRSELLHRIKSDRVIATHYASFDINKVRAVTVTRPRAVYVSYRKGDKVYWTAKKLMLAEGETLLSDGSSDIRTRCGNRISDVPQLPVEAKGPTPEELDSSVEVAQDVPEEAGLAVASFGMDELGDMPSLDGRTFRSATIVNGTALAQTRSEAPSLGRLGQLALADAVAASPVTVVGWAPFGAVSGSSGSGSSGSPSGTTGSGSDSTGSPSGTGDSGPGSTPDTPTVPTPTPAGGTGNSSENQTPPGNPALPTKPADPVPTKPGTGPAVPPTIPPELLSPAPFPPVQPGQAKPNPAKVPEPSTLWLSGAAFAAMLLLRRKGARKVAAAD